MSASESANTFILCTSAAHPLDPFGCDDPGALDELRWHYKRCFIIDLDERWQTGEEPMGLEGWTILSGSLSKQLSQLVFDLRRQVG